MRHPARPTLAPGLHPDLHRGLEPSAGRERSAARPTYPFNAPARLFRDLLTLWHEDCASDRVERLAAELAARAAAACGPLCLGLLDASALGRLSGLVFVLRSYGVDLSRLERDRGDGVYLFLEPERFRPSSYVGVVSEIRVPDVGVPALARAA